MSIKVIDAMWFRDMTMGTKIIGVVLGEDTITKEVKAYLGVGMGNDEARDASRIVDLGQKFKPDTVIEFLGRANQDKGGAFQCSICNLVHKKQLITNAPITEGDICNAIIDKNGKRCPGILRKG